MIFKKKEIRMKYTTGGVDKISRNEPKILSY